jgi:hypothetical protein
MATAITSHTIGSDLKSKPDEIWSAETLPAGTTKLSDAFLLGGTVGGVEVKVVCETGKTLTGSLTIKLQTSATSGGTYADVVSATEVIDATTVIAAGDELARFVLPREVVDTMYTKIELVTSADDSAAKVDAYLVALTK